MITREEIGNILDKHIYTDKDDDVGHEPTLLGMYEATQAVYELINQSQWQSIETAPKDGTEIIAYEKDSNGRGWFFFVHWNKEEEWVDDEFNNIGWYDDHHNYRVRLTYWMPLPGEPK